MISLVCTFLLAVTPSTAGSDQFDIVNPDFWNPNPGPSLQTGRTCANSVPGIVQGSSLCMDTSEGAQCTVTCMGGATGEGNFICENGIWVGDLTCQLPRHFSQGECADSVQGVPFSSSRCLETYQGAECTVTCTDGTTEESTFTCLNGIWIGELACQPLSKSQFDIMNPLLWDQDLDIMNPLFWDQDLDIMNPLFWDQDLSPSFDGIFPERPAEWNMPTGKCTDSVQVPFGISRCMDTSEGDQCIVTCMGGKTGVGAFICANGNWMGDFNVCRPPQDQRDAGRRLLHVGRLLSLEE